jgi:predicted transcriptional regulator
MVRTPKWGEPSNSPGGPRQKQLLHDVRVLGTATVRDVMAHGSYSLNVNTIASVLSSLYKKGFLIRTMNRNKAWVYSARETVDEATAAVAKSCSKTLLDSVPVDPLRALVEAIAECEPSLIEALADLVEQKKTQYLVDGQDVYRRRSAKRMVDPLRGQ